jgi:hypothetical protein
MTMECWPRYVDPKANPNGQYDGWPVTVSQKDNYAKIATGSLPALDLTNCNKPVVEVIAETTGELVYSLRVNQQVFRPDVFEDGKYLIKVTDDQSGKYMVFNHLTPDTHQLATLKVDFDDLKA